MCGESGLLRHAFALTFPWPGPAGPSHLLCHFTVFDRPVHEPCCVTGMSPAICAPDFTTRSVPDLYRPTAPSRSDRASCPAPRRPRPNRPRDERGRIPVQDVHPMRSFHRRCHWRCRQSRRPNKTSLNLLLTHVSCISEQPRRSTIVRPNLLHFPSFTTMTNTTLIGFEPVMHLANHSRPRAIVKVWYSRPSAEPKIRAGDPITHAAIVGTPPTPFPRLD